MSQQYEDVAAVDSPRYALVGWLAIAQAVLLFPEIGLGLILSASGNSSAGVSFLLVPLKVVGLAVGVYVLYMFRRLLNGSFAFHNVDLLITILIWTNVFFFVLGLLGLAPGLESVVGITVAILIVPFGIVEIVFGVKLLKLNNDLFGLLKPFAYTTIAAGIGAASFILAPIGLLAAIAAIIIQGMIFLRADQESQIL